MPNSTKNNSNLPRGSKRLDFAKKLILEAHNQKEANDGLELRIDSVSAERKKIGSPISSSVSTGKDQA